MSEWSGTLKLPSSEHTIYLSLEKDPQERIWMIGVHHNYQVQQFIARTMDDERKILEEFVTYLADHENLPLMCFSDDPDGFDDFRAIIDRSGSLGIDCLRDLSNRLWLDMGLELRQSLSSDSYHLKELAGQLDYLWTHKFDQETLSVLYQERVESLGELDAPFIKMALEYNSDRLLSMPFLISHYGEHVEEMQINDHMTAEEKMEWINQNAKLIHSRSDATVLYFSRWKDTDAKKYLNDICTPPLVRHSKYHVGYSWVGFTKDVMQDLLRRYDVHVDNTKVFS